MEKKEVLLSASRPVWERAQQLAHALEGIDGDGYSVSVKDLEDGLDAVPQVDMVVLIHGKLVAELHSFIGQSTVLAPEVPLLVVDVPRSGQVIAQYVMDGACGCLLLQDGVAELVDALERIEVERPYLPPTVQAALLEEFVGVHRDFVDAFGVPNSKRQNWGLDGLTDRECEVLELVEQGLLNREIADRLFLEVGTVKNHVHSILAKLDVPDREAAGSFMRYAESFSSASTTV